MSKKITSIRGMNDILPEQAPLWQWLEARVQRVLGAYGYQQIRFPVVERTELFKRGIGEVTDIVEKEMYTFEDRNGDSLTLRPEGTACCVRAAEQHGLLYNQSRRLWYTGPMFRHERPQAGRYRQFHQIGVETFGMAGPDIDAEVILLTARLWRELGLQGSVKLELNTLGDAEDRARFREALVAFLREHQERLDDDSRNRVERNPLRVLDSKDLGTREVLQHAPKLIDYLGEASREHFETLCALLDAAGIEYLLNPNIVRGLDYYGRTVFEWTTDALGAQGTVCAGGRYDGLVAQLGGKPTPAVGFAMGVERLILLLEQLDTELPAPVALYITAMETTANGQVQGHALALAERLRDALPGQGVQCHCGGGSFKSQMKKADRSGARYALILGEDEVAQGQVTVKPLREQTEQLQLSVDEVAGWLAARLDR